MINKIFSKIGYSLLIIALPVSVQSQIKIQNLSLVQPDSAVLYIGVTNEIVVRGAASIKQLRLHTADFHVSPKKPGHYNATVSKSGPVKIEVFDNNKRLGSFTFEARHLTEPVAMLGNYRNATLDANTLAKHTYLNMVSNCLMKLNAQVLSFEIEITSTTAAFNKTGPIQGNRIPQYLIKTFARLHSGDTVYFHNIRPNWPDHPQPDSFFIKIK